MASRIYHFCTSQSCRQRGQHKNMQSRAAWSNDRVGQKVLNVRSCNGEVEGPLDLQVAILSIGNS